MTPTTPESRLAQFASFCDCTTSEHPYLGEDQDAETAQTQCAEDIRAVIRKLDAAKSVLWMAEQYAEGHAIAETAAEQRELDAVMEILKS